MLSSKEIQLTLGKHRIVPVVVLDHENDADPLAKALIAGGLPIAEVTFRTDAAEASIRKMARIDGLLLGAGTVLSVEQVDIAVNSGAQFIVAPGFNPKVVSHCLDIGIPVFPGVSSPTEIEMALEYGLKTLKFFPAEALGGVSMLNAISAPYSGIQFMPTGGINQSNLTDYLTQKNIIACGGSWMVKPKLFKDKNFSPVEAAVKQAVELVANSGS